MFLKALTGQPLELGLWSMKLMLIIDVLLSNSGMFLEVPRMKGSGLLSKRKHKVLLLSSTVTTLSQKLRPISGLRSSLKP